MTRDSERFDKNERRNSLVAFLRSIKFRRSGEDQAQVGDGFAQPQPRARQRAALAEENYWIRSAN